MNIHIYSHVDIMVVHCNFSPEREDYNRPVNGISLSVLSNN